MKERDWQLYESLRRVYHFVEDNPLATPRYGYAKRLLEKWREAR